MRFLLAGLFAFIFPIVALAQVRGEVEGIGFANHYRPDCWTPMVVKLLPETSAPGDYIIQVIQEDLDKDLVLAERRISVTGNAEGQAPREQRYWMYFKPQPTRLSDNLKELQDQLKVFICTDKQKQIAQLPITSTIIDIEPKSQGFQLYRGNKLIVCVAEGNNLPSWRDYENAVGLNENIIMVTVQPHLLPEDPRGYDSVDAILWFNVNPDVLNSPNPEKMVALKEYVRSGGQLVICQPPERDRMLAFSELMPVIVSDIENRSGIVEIRDIYRTRTGLELANLVALGPIRLARSTPKSDTVVSRWITWNPETSDRSPYIARRAYGLGAVTWVAQNLGDPALTSAVRFGWPWIWDEVFDWPNLTNVITDRTTQKQIVEAFDAGSAVDLGGSLLSGMEHTKRASALIGLAVLFFLVYWVVAGPGVYLYLVAKKRSHLSWFMFGASAVVAAGLTVLVVQLVLRGSPVVHHVSLVQVAPNQPAIVRTRFGLYIPRDGWQHVELKNATSGHLNYLAPFAMQPAHNQSSIDFPARMAYIAPIRAIDAGEAIALDIPYRSTLKKLEAQWTGTISGGVDGSATLRDQSTGTMIEGSLTNGTGKTLRNIYIAFAYPISDGNMQDQVIFLSSWDTGVTIKLQDEIKNAKTAGTERNNLIGQPDRDQRLKGPIDRDLAWDRYWFAKLYRSSFEEYLYDDSREAVPSSFPVLSLFDRLPPRRNTQERKRVELLRRGVRHLDLSHLISAGKMVVLAEAEGPLPFPLEVEGDIIPGEGTVLYQFVLPLDRGGLDSPTTQPDVEG